MPRAAMTRAAALPALLLVLLLAAPARAQQQQPKGKDRRELAPVQPESNDFRRRRALSCDPEFRELDGACSNDASQARKLWGSTNRPLFTYFAGRSTETPSGDGLRSAREVSNIVFASCKDVFDPRGVNELATFFGQFVDHNLVATPANKAEPSPIPVLDDDPVFGNRSAPSCGFGCPGGVDEAGKGFLPFVRSERVRVRRRDTEQRPQNSLTSALDLVAVYGASKRRSDALRSGSGGRLRTSSGDFMPQNAGRFNNAPDSADSSFFFAGDHRANEHPLLTALHTIFVREHNSLAAELEQEFPQWSDQRLFDMARKINSAQFQKVTLQEWYPAVTGTSLPRYRRFNSNVDLSVSVLFSTAAFRVGHTMVGNGVSRRGPGGRKQAPLSFCEMFFRGADFFKRGNLLEAVTRGAALTRAQRVDVQVRDSLRNFLFSGIPGDEDGVDLVALNIQRGRDHALPSYNRVCTRFGQRKKTRFSQITRDRNVQSRLATAYSRVEEVEAWPGMLAEDLQRGSSLPPCLLAIWQEEFRRIRDGDRFYYENGEQFPREVRDKIQRVSDLFDKDVDTFRAIVLRNSEVKAGELPKRMFFWN